MKKEVKLAAFVVEVTMSPDTEFITIKRDRALEAVEFIEKQLKKYSGVGRKKKPNPSKKTLSQRKWREKQKPSE